MLKPFETFFVMNQNIFQEGESGLLISQSQVLTHSNVYSVSACVAVPPISHYATEGNSPSATPEEDSWMPQTFVDCVDISQSTGTESPLQILPSPSSAPPRCLWWFESALPLDWSYCATSTWISGMTQGNATKTVCLISSEQEKLYNFVVDAPANCVGLTEGS